MSKKEIERPPEGTPEFKEWLKKEHAKTTKKVFGDKMEPAEFDESAGIAGGTDILDKSDAELFPDDPEDYTPEERKPKLVVSNSQETKK